MKPSSAYIVCANPRSGGGVLGSALWQTNLAGRPDQYFGRSTKDEYWKRWNAKDESDYVARVIAFATTPNGVFGARFSADNLAPHDESASTTDERRRPAVIDCVLQRLPTPQFVWLQRRDKIRQAISLWKAHETGAFSLREGETIPDQPEFDREAIETWIESLRSWDETISSFFQNHAITPLTLVYEDDLESNWRKTASRLLDALGIDLPPNVTISSNYRKQSNAHSERMYELYCAGETSEP